MKKFSFSAAIAVSTALVAGCASVKNNYVPRTEQISFPPLNESRIATLGEEMLSQGTATTTQGMLLTQSNKIGAYNLNAGFYPQTGADEEYIFTSFEIRPTTSGLGYIQMDGGFLGAIALPNGLRFSRETQETCLIIPNAYGFSQPVCDTEYGYQYTERPLISDNTFQQTLIYSGRVGDRIRISYREFSGNMARSAFANEAEYDLSTSNIIAYRGARIRVIRADN